MDLDRLVREYGSERNLADRIQDEMASRGWSQARLSKEMAANGCPIHQSAISKIVSPPDGDGRRSVSVDEALGFAKTFGLGIAELLVPAEDLTSTRAAKLVTEGLEAYKQKVSAESRYVGLTSELVNLALNDKGVSDALVEVLANETEGKENAVWQKDPRAMFLYDVVRRIHQEKGLDDGE